MVTVHDVKAGDLIEAVKEELKSVEVVTPPEWSNYVKTSTAKERPPEQDDWWYSRAASVLRKIYMKGPYGINSLRREYSSRKDRGHKPDHSRIAGGKIMRTIVQQLEETGFIENEEGEGRKITSKGQSFLDNLAKKIKED